MGRLIFSGDIHGEIEINKLTKFRRKNRKLLELDDVLIICGDFGLLWNYKQSESEKYWIKWLNRVEWTTCFVDGNHENFDLLNKLPTEERWGGKVGKVSDKIFHLKRGEVYEINGKKILAFGGATSVDKAHRIEGISWWRDEVPSHLDMENALNNIEKHKKVDYIVAHTLPCDLAQAIFPQYEVDRVNDPTGRMLKHICETVEFSEYFCGHWHVDKEVEVRNRKYNILYKDLQFNKEVKMLHPYM